MHGTAVWVSKMSFRERLNILREKYEDMKQGQIAVKAEDGQPVQVKWKAVTASSQPVKGEHEWTVFLKLPQTDWMQYMTVKESQLADYIKKAASDFVNKGWR
jgi:hypothetical protein